MIGQRVLVTGGTGFVGSNLALTLASQGHEVITIDKEFRPTLSDPRIKQVIKPLEDLVDPATTDWDSFIGPIDILFHQAAITDTYVTDHNEMFRVNLHLSMDLFQKAAKKGCKKIVYASSTAVYGDAQAPYKEGVTKEFPINPYGSSKMALDQFASGFPFYNKDLVIIGLRYSNVYGPREKHKGKMASMIYQLAQQMIKGNPRIFKFGEQEREFNYIEDVVRANILASESKESCIVNCGTGKPVSFNQIIEILNEVLGTARKPEYFDNPHPETYQSRIQCDMSLAKAKIGFEPQFDIESGIKAYHKSGFLTA